MASILITGVAGFIGSHLAERLLQDGHQVTGIDCFDPFYPRAIKEQNLLEIRKKGSIVFYELDFSQPGALDKITEKFDVVVHLAAKAGVLPSINESGAYIQSNIVGTQLLLEFMKARSIKKMVFASSSSVYGNNPTPFAEDQDVSMPISPYAFTKKACELMNHTYHHLFGLDIVNLRFFTVYGERQRPDLAIHKFTKAIKAGLPITMYGNGETARDYTYVLDIVEGVYKAIQYVMLHKNVYEVINIGNNSPVALKEMIGIIYEVLGKKPQVIQGAAQPGDVEITYADISKARQLLGYEPTTSFRKGIEKFALWLGQS